MALGVLERLLSPYAAAITGAPSEPDESAFYEQLAQTSRLGEGFGDSDMLDLLQGIRSRRGGKRPGEIRELIYGGNRFNPSSSDPSHQGHLHVAARRVNPLLRQINRMPGFNVGENPRFGGVGPGHTQGSLHYQGQAGDVNYAGGGRFDSEAQALAWLERFIARQYGMPTWE